MNCQTVMLGPDCSLLFFPKTFKSFLPTLGIARENAMSLPCVASHSPRTATDYFGTFHREGAEKALEYIQTHIATVGTSSMSSSLESSQKGRNGHVAKNGPGGSTDAEEKPQAAVTAHSNASCFSSDVVKSMLFGGLDGIITTFAIIAAGEGGGYSTQLILLMGFSKILADATSMGVGDFISERAEHISREILRYSPAAAKVMGVGDFISERAELEYHRSEMAREIHEITHKPDAERQEMVDIYMQKGMSAEHAERMVALFMRNNQ
eukprot:g2263.t1